MLLTGCGEVKDLNLRQLREFLEIIDTKLHMIDTSISQSADPDSDGLFDQGEYFIGIGFVVIQQHLTDSLIGMGLNKTESLSLGEIHPSGVPSISVINAAANWWKHEAEWVKANEAPKNGRTFKIVMNISNQYDYALSNILASFSESKSLIFVDHVIPHIEKWTQALHANNELNKRNIH